MRTIIQHGWEEESLLCIESSHQRSLSRPTKNLPSPPKKKNPKALEKIQIPRIFPLVFSLPLSYFHFHNEHFFTKNIGLHWPIQHEEGRGASLENKTASVAYKSRNGQWHRILDMCEWRGTLTPIDTRRTMYHPLLPHQFMVSARARAYTITVGSALYRVWNSGALFPFVSRDLWNIDRSLVREKKAWIGERGKGRWAVERPCIIVRASSLDMQARSIHTYIPVLLYHIYIYVYIYNIYINMHI